MPRGVGLDRYTFKITDLLGEGSFGKVYRARSLERRRDEALKVIQRGALGADEWAMVRRGFEREMAAARHLDTDHVVRVYEAVHAYGRVVGGNRDLLKFTCRQNGIALP